MPEQTDGEYRVGVSFNPSANPLVDEIKKKTAELIDLCLGIADVNGAGAVAGEREAYEACSFYETAAMWAVKAATKQPR